MRRDWSGNWELSFAEFSVFPSQCVKTIVKYINDAVQRKSICLVSPSDLESLIVHRAAAAMFLLHQYCDGHCSQELTLCVPLPTAWPPNTVHTQKAGDAHKYRVSISIWMLSSLLFSFHKLSVKRITYPRVSWHLSIIFRPSEDGYSATWWMMDNLSLRCNFTFLSAQ